MTACTLTNDDKGNIEQIDKVISAVFDEACFGYAVAATFPTSELDYSLI